MTLPDLAERFVVVSSYFPPVVGGTSTVLRNLLGAFRPETFHVVAESPSSFDGEHNARVPEGVQVTRAGVAKLVTGRIPYGVKLARWLRFGLIPHLENKIISQKPQRIIAVYPSWPFLVAAYRVHLRTGVPLFTYYMDVSADASRLAWPDRPIVRRYEQRILRAATQRLVLSDAIREDFATRFGLSSVVIPHTIALAQTPVESAVPASLKILKDRKLIVHTGVVEGLQREGLLRLARVIHDHPELNAQLVLSTPTSHADLRANGFDLPWVQIGTFTSAEVASLQRAADLLIGVLPFEGAIEAYQRTAFPTKVVEYMTSGVPILAHAPADSFFAAHVRQHGYALLVDRADGDLLRQALVRALGDVALREELVLRARTTVQSVFALQTVAPRFAEACGLAPTVLR